MSMKQPTTRVSLPLRLSCRIDSRDVEDMLDTYDSGMCDISTANCISRVIARQLSGDRGIRLIRHNKDRADLEFLGHRIPVSTKLLKWLVAAETGGHVDPIEIVLIVPETGPSTITVFPMATAPSANPPKDFVATLPSARLGPIVRPPGPRCGKEATPPQMATRANFNQVNGDCRSGLTTRHQLEVMDHLREF
jgi:hypothetical protein